MYSHGYTNFKNNKEYNYVIYFRRSDDYLKVRRIRQITVQQIEYIYKKATFNIDCLA